MKIKTRYIKYLLILIIILFSLLFIITIYTNNLNTLQNVDVIITDMAISEPKITSCKIILTVEISNPSNYEISDLNSDFEIFLDQNYIGEGNISNISISSNSIIEEEIPIVIYYSRLADATLNTLYNVINGQKTELTVDGVIYTKIFFNLFTLYHNFSLVFEY